MKYNINDYSLEKATIIDKLYCEAYKITCKPDPKKFPRYKENDVIDENKSVKWNREEIIRLNQMHQNEVVRLNRIRNSEIFELDSLVKALIIDEIKYSIKNKSDAWYENAAKLIFKEAYERGHSYGMYDVIMYINNYIDLIINIISFKGKK